MSDDPRRTGFCTPRCYRECQCSRWPDLLDRWGNPVNHGGGTSGPPWWNPDGATSDALTFAWDATGAASYAASLIELAHGGAALTEIGGGPPSWAAGEGWHDFLVLTRCLDTGVIPDEGWSILIQLTDGVANVESLAGAYNDAGGGNATFILQNGPLAVRSYSGTALNNITNAPFIAAGNYGVAGKTPYRDGIAEPAGIGAGACVIPIVVFLGALNYDGGAVQHTAAKIRAALLYDGILTGPQMLARATAMAAL